MANPCYPGRAPVPLEEQIAAVERRAAVALDPDIAAALDAVAATLRDYQAMQPKVLAIAAVNVTLAGRLKISEAELDDLLTRAEADAVHQLEEAKKATTTVLVADGAPAWPFPKGQMP